MRSHDISACVIDIDATITDDRAEPQIHPEHPLNNAVLNVIVQLMVEKGRGFQAARQALVDCGAEKVFWDYPDFLEAFDLPEKEAWKRLVRWHEEQIIVYQDAVAMVRRLHGAGLPLFIVSNNPLSGCLLKLHRAGLSELRESKYFRGMLGSNVCMGQKCIPEFWERCFDRIGCQARQVAIIGDNPKEDCAIPRTLGVETVFLVDRTRKKSVERTPEAFLVNTLESVPEILFRLPEWSDAAREEVDAMT